jgi:hypothetical protein
MLWEEENLLALQGIELQFHGSPACSLVTIAVYRSTRYHIAADKNSFSSIPLQMYEAVSTANSMHTSLVIPEKSMFKCFTEAGNFFTI